jgi:ribose/xylose/arabinose/galactoside ABC-type transport system permease subunit
MTLAIKDAFQRFRRTPAFTGFSLFVLALILNAAIQGPAKFLSPRSFNTLLATNLPFLIVVMGQSILLLVGTLDISIGIQLALVNVVVVMTIQEWGVSFWTGCLFGITASLLISVLLWVSVSIFRLPALLASFSMTYIIKGINVLIMPVPQGKIERVFYRTYDRLLFGVVPFSLLIFIFVLLIWYYFKRTRFGTNIYAVGADRRNAFAAGISPKWVTLQAFLIKGLFVGIAGICLTLLTASGNPIQAEDYGIKSLSACIIGGLGFGGWGSMACGLFGGSFLIIIQNTVYYFFTMLYKLIPGFSVTTYWHNFVSDVIIFLGLLMTIVTAKGQREALRQGIAQQLKQKKEDFGGKNGSNA